ncbi:hypothetical protein [Tessaracoccus sp. MC1756]|uniref:hypothetical protein n=1 Tax=Tessaracoccus sp. MC1756 TaxID=2760311 RepID=UPI0015FFF9BE|nr:hypothetical protein [Tessaracoccus sp. MC1756]MBB1510058.1 hypothetical protein [Tessaracoccus sp. MC1756]
MTRHLPSWAQPRRSKPKPRLTLVSDLIRLFQAVPGRRPAGAPKQERTGLELAGRMQLPQGHLTLSLLSLRFDIELVGIDTLNGLRQPLVFAVNEQGVLDYQILRMALPSRMRPTNVGLSRALVRGRNVVSFTDDPPHGRLVGDFTTVAAELANQHNVAIIPVGLAGTFKLKDILKLPLTTKPKVSIRFGAPIYVRGRSLAEATAELQLRVEQLVHEGELTWWTVERRRQGHGEPAAPTPTPRWRRLWDQTAPKPEDRNRIWR